MFEERRQFDDGSHLSFSYELKAPRSISDPKVDQMPFDVAFYNAAVLVSQSTAESSIRLGDVAKPDALFRDIEVKLSGVSDNSLQKFSLDAEFTFSDVIRSESKRPGKVMRGNKLKGFFSAPLDAEKSDATKIVKELQAFGLPDAELYISQRVREYQVVRGEKNTILHIPALIGTKDEFVVEVNLGRTNDKAERVTAIAIRPRSNLPDEINAENDYLNLPQGKDSVERTSAILKAFLEIIAKLTVAMYNVAYAKKDLGDIDLSSIASIDHVLQIALKSQIAGEYDIPPDGRRMERLRNDLRRRNS